jgi:RimJ/RimL family protein N-acetyltransferase
VRLPESLTLSDGNVVLRDWRPGDAPALRSICGDPDVCRFTSVPWTYERAAATDWVVRVRDGRSTGTTLALAIAELDADLPVGNVNLVRFSADGRNAALGYWLVPAARRRGLATRAARLLCGWGFEHLGLRRIELAILPGNAASQGVAERLGAQARGLRRDSHRAAGRAWDMLIYELERPEGDGGHRCTER